MEGNNEIEMQPVGFQTNKSSIKLIGVGGSGCNLVTRMYEEGIENIEFIICNTDYQALQSSPVPEKLQLGATLTKGLGAGCDPEKGRNAALESTEEIKKMLKDNIKMVFVTAGMGGGTGTGASPIIAKIAKEKGLLTIGVITYPFRDESYETLMRAYNGIEELKQYVDSLIIIDNQKIYDIYGNLMITEAFEKADNVLVTAVKGIADIITSSGIINVDMADVTTVMKDGGMALMGIGSANGPNRAMEAVERAITSPLLKDFDFKTARKVLINISSSKKNGLRMDEQRAISNYIEEFTGNTVSKFKRGVVFDDNMEEGYISITIVATGFKTFLVPPTKMHSNANDDTAVTMINEAEENKNEILLPIDEEIIETRIKDIVIEDIPVYTPDQDISDFENETALDRRNRIKKEKALKAQKAEGTNE